MKRHHTRRTRLRGIQSLTTTLLLGCLIPAPSWHRMIELLVDAKGVEMFGPYPWAEALSSP